MAHEIVVEPLHFAYLRLQKGSLSNVSGNFEHWMMSYQSSLENDMFSIQPFLPHDCKSVLDIGSGLGGIDVHLNRWYGGELSVTLLDGVADEPIMKLHRQTFNNMEVARDFLLKNGVKSMSYISPEMAKSSVPSKRYDLVISLGSWCFHYPPSYYLSFVRGAVKKGSVLILDVRNGKDDWAKDLQGSFDFIGDVLKSRKWTRKAYVTK